MSEVIEGEVAESDDRMTEDELLSFLDAHQAAAINYFEDETAKAQQEALDRYHGKEYGDEQDGRSRVISLDVREVVDWTMPDLMDEFGPPGKAVSFLPVGDEDDAVAEQRTNYINYVFYKDNKGEEIIHDCFKDSLIQRNGFTKCWWEEKEETEPEVYEDISTAALAVFANDSTVDIVDFKTKNIRDFDKLDPLEQQLYSDGKKHTISITRDKGGRVRIAAIPPEEVLVARQSRSLEDAAYVAHRSEKTISDIIAEGLASKEVAMDLTSSDSDGELRKRKRFKDENQVAPPETDETRKVWVFEEYIRVDWDGDGIAERRQVIRVGKDILSNRAIDYLPIVSFTPVRMPHKVYGLGLADYALDIARLKTVIWRQMLDNLYLTNNPRKLVNMQYADERTIDQLLDTRVGALVQIYGSPSEAVKTDTTEFVAGAAFDMLNYTDRVSERRTGITNQSQGLPDGFLDKTKTATEVDRLSLAIEKRKAMIVRSLASSMELLFQKINKLVMDYQDFTREIRLHGNFVPVDPRSWNASADTTINVGLGTGNKQQKIAALESVLVKQVQAIESGSGLADEAKVYQTLKDWAEAAGVVASRYFNDPNSENYEQPEEQEPIEIQRERIKGQIQLEIETKRIASRERIAKYELEGEAKLTAFKLASGEDDNTNLRRQR